MERVIALAREGKYPAFVPSLAMQEENRRYEEQSAERRRQEKKAAEAAKREAAQSKGRGQATRRTVPKWAVDLKAKAT